MKYGVMFLLCLFLVGCGNEEVTDSTENKNTDTEVTFQMRNIDQKVKNNQVAITAEVSTSENEIFFLIEQGEELVQEETSIEVDENAEWHPISIKYELTEQLIDADEPPIIKVFVKDDSEQPINPNYIPIDA